MIKPARTEAILPGTIGGDGKAATYSFQWGESEALGQSTPAHSAGSGEEKVEATLSGLEAGTTYFYRIVGENENGANYGLIRQFQTAPAVEDLTSEAVKNLEPESATLAGSLKPGGLETSYFFQWGSSTAYGNSTPEASAGAGAEKVFLQANISHLSANTTYHYRLVARNQYGTSDGEDQSFISSGAPRITNEAPTGLGHEEAVLHAKINPDELTTTYHFEYGESTTYGSEAPLGGQSVGAGANPVAVSLALAKLEIGTIYHYRVIAENAIGKTVGPDQHFTTVPPAQIDASSVAQVGESEATLQSEVNPLGNETRVYFQYGGESCQANPGACTDVPALPGTDIGAGQTDEATSQTLGGLKAGATYFYRVLASNSLGTAEGPQHAFTTRAAEPFVLPDHRAWEMVSPPDKQGAPVEALTREGGVILASEDGDSFTYVANGALDEEAQGNRSPEWQQVLATRGEHGWSSQDIATPNAKAKGVTAGATPEYQFFTPDLSLALVQPTQLGLDAEPPLAAGVTQATMYIRDNATETYLPLVTEGDVAAGTVFGGQIRFVNATPDLSHVVIGSAVALTGSSSAPGLYEWSQGQLQLVSVLPSGAPAKGAELGYANVAANAISTDGSRLIWTTPETEKFGHLYMRDSETGETVQLDAAQGVHEPSGVGSARFQTASSDGSRVFFTDRQAADARLDRGTGAVQAGSVPVRNGHARRQARVSAHRSDRDPQSRRTRKRARAAVRRQPRRDERLFCGTGRAGGKRKRWRCARHQRPGQSV